MAKLHNFDQATQPPIRQAKAQLLKTRILWQTTTQVIDVIDFFGISSQTQAP